MFFKKKPNDKKFELIPQEGIRVIDNDEILKLGMTENRVSTILIPVQNKNRTTIFNYPDKEQEIEKSIWYNDMAINIIFKNGKAALIQFPYDSGYYFKEVNLGNNDYKAILNSLQKMGYTSYEDNDNTSYFEKLNLFIYHPEKTETSGIYADDYYDFKKEDKYTTVSRHENGITIINHKLK